MYTNAFVHAASASAISVVYTGTVVCIKRARCAGIVVHTILLVYTIAVVLAMWCTQECRTVRHNRYAVLLCCVAVATIAGFPQ